MQQVKQEGFYLDFANYLLKQDREIVLAAVRQNGRAIIYADRSLKKDREIILEAAKKHAEALKFVDPLFSKDREIVLEAVKRNLFALEYASGSLKKDRDFMLECVKENRRMLLLVNAQKENDFLRKDKEFMLNIEKLYGKPLELVKKDRELVLEAVKQDGRALQYADVALKKDREIVLEAIKQDGSSLEHADGLFKKDREIVLESVKRNGFALKFSDNSFKNDREIVLEAVKRTGLAIQYTNDSFKKDRDLAMEAIKEDSGAISHVNELLKKDREFVLECVKQDSSVFFQMDESFKNDMGFVYSLFKNRPSLVRKCSRSITEKIENCNISLLQKLSNSNIIEQYSNNFIEESDLYYCIELGSVFQAKNKSTLFNANPIYSAMFIEKLLVFQILNQLKYDGLSDYDVSSLEIANYYLFCFRLEKFLEDNIVQPTRMRDLKVYIDQLVSNFESNFYSKKEMKEILNFAYKWLEDWQTFNNYKHILSRYNELRGDLSKVFKALSYFYNYFKNDYDFISILGYGGEGAVFKVFQKDVKSIRALKLKYDPEQSIESGNQTMNLLKRNDIEGKIKCFDCGIIQNHLYSVMEIGEESLSNFISRSNENGIYGNGFMSKDKLEEIIVILIKVLNSVQSIHNHNILHRDLDPNNIVKVKETYKIIDFETSRVVKKGNSITIGLGKYSYMSPEISQDSYSDDEFTNDDNEKLAHNVGIITTSCDIFSLGCIFLKLLTNCPLQLDQQFINDPDISKYDDNDLFFTGYGKYFYTVVTTTEGEMKLHYAIQKLINKSIDPQLGVNNLLIRSIITMIQRDSTSRLDCYSHKIILDNILKYLRGGIKDLTLNIGKEIGGMKQITQLRSYSQLVNENSNLVEKVINQSKEISNLSSENNNLLERIKILEQELSKLKNNK